MSQLVRLEGKRNVQRAHCALNISNLFFLETSSSWVGLCIPQYFMQLTIASKIGQIEHYVVYLTYGKYSLAKAFQ